MAKLKINQNSFVGGVLDPSLFGRTDISNYHAGAAMLENVVVLPQGGVKRRPGLKYIAPVVGKSRILPFVFNDEEQYLFVLSAQQIKIYRQEVEVATLTSGPIANITEDMLDALNWAQSNDVLFLVHPNLAPLEVARITDTQWQVRTIALQNIPPYAFNGITQLNPEIGCTPSGVSGSVELNTVTDYWLPEHVGQFVNINDGRIFIEEVISATSVRGTVRIELTSSDEDVNTWAIEQGYEPVMSPMRGWARSITFHQGRLVFGGLKSRPQTILFSKVGEFFNFDLGEGGVADGVDVTIDDDRANVIRNIFPGRGLQIFTTGGEFFATSGATGEPLGPQNITLRRGTFHGSNQTRPESVDGATLFVESNGRVIRSFLFSDVEQAFATDDVTLLSAHLINNVQRMALRRSTAADGANFLYVVNGDGRVAVLNTLRSQNLRAWSAFTTDGAFLDVAVLGEETYFLVERTINGVTAQMLERLEDSFFVDAGIEHTTATVQNIWPNLDHLEGREVNLLADGFVLTAQTVTAGSVYTHEGANTLQAGLAFNVTIETLPIVPSFRANTLGELRRIVCVNLLLQNTGQIELSAGKTRFLPALRSFGEGVLDAHPQNYSGWLKVPLGGVSRVPTLKITQAAPVPLHLLSLTIELGV